jgi:hypothetical protein
MSTLPKKLAVKPREKDSQPSQSSELPGIAKPISSELLATKQKKITKADKDRRRILITGCNSLVGHQLFDQMRNDHLMVKTGGKAHEFLGTLVQRDA